MAENVPKHVSEPPTPPVRVKEDGARLTNGGQDRTDRASTTSGGTVVLSDDMLYKLSKKIAQLTKVKQFSTYIVFFTILGFTTKIRMKTSIRYAGEKDREKRE